MLDIISSKNILPNRKWSVTVSWKCIVEQSHPSLWRNQYVCPSWPSDIFWLSHTEPSIYEIRTLSLSDLKGLNTSRDKNHVIHSGICACKCRRKKTRIIPAINTTSRKRKTALFMKLIEWQTAFSAIRTAHWCKSDAYIMLLWKECDKELGWLRYSLCVHTVLSFLFEENRDELTAWNGPL